MAFIKIEDNFGEIEGIVFPGVLKDYQGALQRDFVIIAKGRISGTDKSGAKLVEPKLLIESLQLLGMSIQATTQREVSYHERSQTEKINIP